MAAWIDFKELRSKLSFLELLKHYNVQLVIKGDRASGFCPLPTHQGQRRSPSFSVELKRGIFQCFGCHAKGNVLDFACRMEGFDPTKPQELRKAAIKINEEFLQGGSMPPASPETKKPSSTSAIVQINAPIDFELQSLDPDHPYLKERGFNDDTIQHFGLGFCNRGMLKSRIAIPLHDTKGRLLGYAGRLTKDADISEQNPKYMFPGERERNGTVLEFRKSLLLYNSHRIAPKVSDLIVVEGFPSVWWLHQNNYSNAVALMGSDCSEEQAKLIVERIKPVGRIWLMSDGDAAGDHCAETILPQIAPHRFVRWVKLEDGKQPTSYAADQLRRILAF